MPTPLHAPGGTGRCGFGTAAPRRQRAQPGRHATGRSANALPHHPAVSGHRASTARQRGSHRRGHSSDGAKGPADGSRHTGPRPGQPSGPRRRNRLASERGQRLRVDLQHPTERYFLRRGRGKEEVDEALGDSFSGVLVSDFYAAYHHYDGPKQRCWAHLLGDIHDQRTLYPDAAPRARWADAVHGIYDRAKALLIPRPSGGAPPNWPWNDNCWPSANPSGTTRRQPRPSCADASSATSRACPVLDTGTLRLRGRTRSAFRQQRRRAQPVPPGHQSQGQRRHPLGARHTEQDDAGLPLRHLARAKSKLPRFLPTTANFPATLNCYGHQGSHEYQTRTEIRCTVLRRGNRAGALLVMIQPRLAQSSAEASAWPTGLSNTATHDNVTLSWNDPGAVASDLFGERMPDQRSSGLRRP